VTQLPDSRHDIEARDADGRPVRLVRSISQKLYRCPGCGGEISIGEEHVLALTPEADDGYPHHHWHRTCAVELLAPELRGGRRVRSRN
jgi:hypothetical protein